MSDGVERLRQYLEQRQREKREHEVAQIIVRQPGDDSLFEQDVPGERTDKEQGERNHRQRDIAPFVIAVDQQAVDPG